MDSEYTRAVELSLSPYGDEPLVNELCALFPKISVSRVCEVIQNNHGNEVDSLDELLALQELQSIEQEEKEKVQKKQKKQKKKDAESDWVYVQENVRLNKKKLPESVLHKLESELSQKSQRTVTWEQMGAKAERVSDLLRITLAEARSFLHMSGGDMYKAIMIFLDKVPNEVEFGDNSQQREILSKYLAENDELQKISNKFYDKSLDHFNGDVEAVLILAISFLCENQNALTHKVVKTKIMQPVNFNNDMNRTMAPKTISKQPYLEDDMQKFRADYTVDLHSFSRTEAAQKTDEVLRQWKRTEEKAREEIGTVKRGLNLAVGAGRLKIITGRGLHSDQGKSALKHIVRKKLDAGGFLYDEEVGSYDIYGCKNWNI